MKIFRIVSIGIAILFFLPACSAQAVSGNSLWELHHPHSGMFDRNGLSKESSATAALPALSPSGRAVGTFNVTTTCTTELLNIDAELVNAPSYEIVQVGRTYRAQVEHRSGVTVTLGNAEPILTASLLDKANTVQIQFTEPGFNNVSGALGGAVVLGQMINGARFIGEAAQLYAAPSIRLDIIAQHSSETEVLHFTFNPREQGFQKFARSCDELLPGHEPDSHLLLTERTEDATKFLPAEEAGQLRTIIGNYEQAVKTNNSLGMNEAPTKLSMLGAFGAEKRCQAKDKRSCNAVAALSDLRDAMTIVRHNAEDKRAADVVVEKTLIPANTKLNIVFPGQTDISSAARGEEVVGQLAQPVSKGATVQFAQGTVVHLAVSTLGIPPRRVIGTVKDIMLNGAPVALPAGQCIMNITTDQADPSTQRPRREPGQPPFRAVPRTAAPASHIPAGSVCAIEIGTAVMAK